MPKVKMVKAYPEDNESVSLRKGELRQALAQGDPVTVQGVIRRRIRHSFVSLIPESLNPEKASHDRPDF
jgi:hypothetical protein